MKNSNKIIAFLIAAFIFWLADRLSKNWAKSHLFYERSKSYFFGIFTLDYAENKGAALSFGSNLPENQAYWVLQIMPAVILLLLVIYVFKNLNQWTLLSIISFAGIFAGGLANLVDRFLNNRHVIDFMILNIGFFETGIFNVADLWISLGVIGLLIGSFKK
jgi:signal peptidase II